MPAARQRADPDRSRGHRGVVRVPYMGVVGGAWFSIAWAASRLASRGRRITSGATVAKREARTPIATRQMAACTMTRRSGMSPKDGRSTAGQENEQRHEQIAEVTGNDVRVPSHRATTVATGPAHRRTRIASRMRMNGLEPITRPRPGDEGKPDWTRGDLEAVDPEQRWEDDLVDRGGNDPARMDWPPTPSCDEAWTGRR